MGSIGEASTELCLDVFKELKVQHVNENILFSPLTIISALSMIYIGSRESTRAQIDKVVPFDKIAGFKEAIESQCSASGSFQFSLKDLFSEITKQSDNYSLSFVSRLYAEETYPIRPEYLQCLKDLYKDGVETISFRKAADQAREVINSWVESQTSGAIKDILQPDSVDHETETILVSAIYFKGLWEKAFKDEDNQTVPFKINEQESKPVQMMYQTGSFKVAEVAAEKLKILEIPYAGGQLSMFVLLPDDTSGLEQLESALTSKKIIEWTSSDILEKREVKVYLPRMKIESKYNLTSVLVALGVTDLFSSSANLSEISSAESLKISQAVHEAFVEIYAEGSEAIGLTRAGTQDESVSQEFKADHPFLFLIKHIPTKSILFFGRFLSL